MTSHLKKIMNSKTPGEMKVLATRISNFNANCWVQTTHKIANKYHHAKFIQNSQLADSLLATGNTELVEASPNDHLWGI